MAFVAEVAGESSEKRSARGWDRAAPATESADNSRGEASVIRSRADTSRLEIA